MPIILLPASLQRPAARAWYLRHRLVLCVIVRVLRSLVVYCAMLADANTERMLHSGLSWLPIGVLRPALVKAAYLLMGNSAFILPFSYTAVFNLLIYVPGALAITPLHCRLANPAELAAYAQFASRLTPWLLLPVPLPELVITSAREELSDGMRACIALNVWLPMVVGMAVPLGWLLKAQHSWRAHVVARHMPAGTRQAVAYEPWAGVYVIGLMHVSCTLWVVLAVCWRLV